MTTRPALLALLSLAACSEPIYCGHDDLLYRDPVRDRCVCRSDDQDFVIVSLPDGGETPSCAPGRGDAGTDAGPGPAGLVIALEPTAPRTLDDLRAIIVTEPTDPLGRAITYDYRWLRDGARVDGQTTSTLPHELTRKHETWTVEITPLADGIPGAAARATVEIANTPPTLGTVGLSDYRPIVGDTLFARAGTTADADGDVVTVEYQWRRGITPVGGTAVFSDLVADSEVSVTATPADDESTGAGVTAGPAIVLADTTRWRQLEPNTWTTGGGWVVHDLANERLVVLVAYDERGADDAQLWEYSLPPSGRGSFVRLHPSGTRPIGIGGFTVYDHGNRRIVGGLGVGPGDSASGRVWALDVSRRGSESFIALAPSGDAPSMRLFSAATYDHANRRVLVQGGWDTTRDLDELWSLDVQSPGVERWTRLGATGLAIANGCLAIDEDSGALVLVGGSVSAPGDVFLPRGGAFRLRALDGTWEERPLAGVATAGPTCLSQDGTLRVLSGRRDDRGVERVEVDLDLATMESRIVGDAPPTVMGLLAETASGRVVLWPGATGDGSERLLSVMAETERGRFEALEQPGLRRPVAAAGAAFTSSATSWFEISHGRALGAAVADSWRWESGSWTRLSIPPDSETSGQPEPRYEGPLVDALGSRDDIVLLGGRRSDSALADMRLWTRRVRGGEWVERTVAAGGSPSARSGGVVLPCTGWMYAGGRLSSGALTRETWVSSCPGAAIRGCSWARGPDLPTTREAAALASDDQRTLLFGGRDDTGALASMVAMGTGCGPGSSWSVPTVTGSVPSARWGASFTAVEPPLGTSAATFILYGGADGTRFASDTHVLDRSGTSAYAWRPLVVDGESPPPRAAHAATWDRINRRVLVYGGANTAYQLGDLWELRIRD